MVLTTCLPAYLIEVLEQACKVGVINIPIFQIRNLRQSLSDVANVITLNQVQTQVSWSPRPHP